MCFFVDCKVLFLTTDASKRINLKDHQTSPDREDAVLASSLAQEEIQRIYPGVNNQF